jgi:hypothetical protein
MIFACGAGRRFTARYVSTSIGLATTMTTAPR